MKLIRNMNNNFDSTGLLMISIGLYVVFVITFQAVVGIFTMIAAATTALWNVYKFIMDRKDREKQNKKQNNGASIYPMQETENKSQSNE